MYYSYVDLLWLEFTTKELYVKGCNLMNLSRKMLRQNQKDGILNLRVCTEEADV